MCVGFRCVNASGKDLHMIRFNNDYNHGAHPEILKRLMETNDENFSGYGTDPWCERAADKIRELTACPDAAVWFFPGATQANFVTIHALLGPCDSVIAADTGHINAHECASIENTGHKIQSLPNTDGKIHAEQIEALARAYYEAGEPEYLTRPSMVYISFTTEFGTLYSKAELSAISEVCRKYHMLLFVDGARMAYGLGSEKNDLSLEDFARLTDVFYLGGTKCGALFGEALVIPDPKLSPRFKSYMKQSGAVLAKGWTLGLQFATLLENNLYVELARKADAYAMEIKEAFEKKGISSYIESFTNQQFIVLTDAQMEALSKDFIFEFTLKDGDNRNVVRFCTAWSTKAEEVQALVKAIEQL